MANLEQAILNLQPNAQFTIFGGNYSGISWLSDDVQKPTEEQVNAEIIKLQAAEAQEEQAKAQAKASALDKLAKLGLTEAEVKALIG